jgi:hypothetical protein
MATLALNVEILGEFKKLTNATKGAEGSLAKLNDKVGSVSKGIGRAVGGLAIALGFTGIVSGLKDAVRGAEEAKVANDRIDAIAKSMSLFGNDTKKTTDRIKEFADQQELLVGVEAEVIKATQAKLLTFKEVAKSADTMGGAFDRATIIAQDLAAAGFGEATANATQLGKALNDPIRGISSLTRVGLTFTESQKSVIKSLQESGDMAGAQQVILAELERQVGGTSAATVTSSEKMALAFGAIQDAVGTAVMPVLDGLTSFMIESVPKVEAFFKELMDPSTELGASWTDLGATFRTTGESFSQMMGVFGAANMEFKDLLNFVTMITGGFGQLFFMVGRVADIIGSVLTLNFGRALELSTSFGSDYSGFVAGQNRALSSSSPAPMPTGFKGADRATNITINATTNATAQQIAYEVNRANRNTGTNILRD